MTRKTYATLDVNRVGESLLLDAGQTVVTTTAICDLRRMVLGTIKATDAAGGAVPLDRLLHSMANELMP